MDRASILALLHEHRDLISTRFGARHLALFGSAARDEMRPDSDAAVLVDFDGPATAPSISRTISSSCCVGRSTW